jgi:hypothetical protein
MIAADSVSVNTFELHASYNIVMSDLEARYE